MARARSGKSYAQAVFDLALARNELEDLQKSLRMIADLASDEEARSFLENPHIPFDVKKGLLERWLGSINPLAFNLVLVLTSKGLLRISRNISEHYDDLLDRYRGIERGKVIAAIELGDEEREKLEGFLGRIVNKKVVLDVQMDSSLIGGFIARIRDTLIDGSVRQRLELLRRSLVEAGS